MMNRVAVVIFLLMTHCYLIRTEVCNGESEPTALDIAMRPLYNQLETFKTQLDALEVRTSCTCCGTTLSMEDGRIPDTSITSSSFWASNNDHSARRARPSSTGYASAWSAGAGDSSPWIQVDLGTKVYFTGVITFGRRSGDPYDQWVTAYNVRYSDDGQSWDYVTDGRGIPYQFTGNSDRDTPVTATFPTVLHARFLRILPTAWNIHCSMRFEVLGCS